MVQLLNVVSDLLIPLFLYPGLAFALGLSWSWDLLETRLAAYLYHGHPPRFSQRLYDFVKLAGKEVRPTRGSSSTLLAFLSIVSLASPLLVLAILPLPGNSPQVFPGDVLAAIYLLEIPALAHVLIGHSVPSPYSKRAATRQIMLVLSYGIPLLIATVALATSARSFVIADLMVWPTGPWAIASRALAGVAFLSCLPVKLQAGPFALTEAPEELVAGAVTDITGMPLAIIKLARSFTRIAAVSLFVVIFVPFFSSSLAVNALIYLGAVFVIAVLLSALNSLFARLRGDQVLSIYLWGKGLVPSPTLVALAALLVSSLSSYLA